MNATVTFEKLLETIKEEPSVQDVFSPEEAGMEFPEFRDSVADAISENIPADIGAILDIVKNDEPLCDHIIDEPEELRNLSPREICTQAVWELLMEKLWEEYTEYSCSFSV